MSLMRWQPLKELGTLRQQMNHLFNDFLHDKSSQGVFSHLENLSWTPAIELQETDTDLIVKAQVPGIDPKDLSIQVSEDAVYIAGEYTEEKLGESKGIYHSEFSYGRFQRTLPLPVNVKHEQVTAEVKNGIVTLTLPKADIVKRNVVKVDLTLQEKTREAMAQERQHDQHLESTMQARTLEGLDTRTYSDLPEQAREIMAEERRNEEHLEETMHSRTASEVNPANTTIK